MQTLSRIQHSEFQGSISQLRELERGKQQVYYQGQKTANGFLQRAWKSGRLGLLNLAPDTLKVKDEEQ